MQHVPAPERGLTDQRMPPSPSSQPVWVIAGPLGRDDATHLCERLRVVLATTDAATVVCDVGGLQPDMVTVEALARLQLTARRLGRRIELRGGSPELDRLLCFVGLADALGRGSRRQAEEREQACGVEERVDGGDPAA
jgi:ABC-type transporter Mla MlaB component